MYKARLLKGMCIANTFLLAGTYLIYNGMKKIHNNNNNNNNNKKVQEKAQRIRRYEKRETQYSQNKMFKEDTKRFYRNLGVRNIQARQPPSMAEAETYWKSLWGEEAQHNKRAEWIRREQKRKVSYMGWMPI